jgi:hypothetical protein
MVNSGAGAVENSMSVGSQLIGSASLAPSDELCGDDDDIISRLSLIRSICEVGG